MAQKITCPVCYTKMNPVGHDMVCPECGYKYCEGRVPYTYDDHNHNEYKSYNQKTSYSTGYTTSQGSSAAPQSKTTYGSYSTPQSNVSRSSYSSTQSTTASGSYAAPQRSAAAGTYSNTQSATASGSYAAPQRSTASTYSSATAGSYSAGRKPKKASVGKFVFMMVIFYVIIVVIAMVFGFVSEFLANGGSNDVINKLFSSNNSVETMGETIHYKSAEELLEDYKRLSSKATPQTVTQSLLCDATSKSLNEITKRDCERFISIHVYVDDLGMTVDYVLDDEDNEVQTLETTYDDFDPSELQLFTNLQIFRTSGNVGAYFEPGQLHDLRDLYYLECSNTPEELLRIVDPLQLDVLCIETPSSYVDLDKLSEFANLSSFCVVAQGLENASQIGELPNLYYLDIITDWENSDYSFLESLKYLRYLYLTSTYLDDVSFLKGMEDLDTLVITDTYELTDISAITSCKELTALEICNVPEIKDFSPIGELTELQYFVIDACDLKDLSWASSLKEVGWISIEDNQVSSLAPLAALPNLDAVFCRGNNITDFGDLDPSIVDME